MEFNSEDYYIVISEWQKFLSLWEGHIDDAEHPPEWKCVPRRSFRYGNAQNVCMWTQEMQDWLMQKGIQFWVGDRDGKGYPLGVKR